MMPDLGNYSTSVISAYVISLIVITCFVILTLVKSNKVKKELQEAMHKIQKK